MPQERTLSSMIHNIASTLFYIFYVIAIVVMPLMIINSALRTLEAEDPKEKKCRLLSTIEMFCYCYALYGLLLIPILHNTFDEWWIWSVYPSFWEIAGGFKSSDKFGGVLADALTCGVLAPCFGIWSKRFGIIYRDVYLPK